MNTKTVTIKQELCRLIEKRWVSVQSVRGKIKIKIAHRIGVEQAFAHRDTLSKLGYHLFFYGIYDKSGQNCIERHSVRITI